VPEGAAATEKLFGVFEHRVEYPPRKPDPVPRLRRHVLRCRTPATRPCRRADIDACPALRVLAESDAAGPYLLSTENGRQIFVTGHPEYDKLTLDAEYRRDVDKGLPIHVPLHYYPDDDPAREPLFRWRAHAHLLYQNWLNYYVYQETPYDLRELGSLPRP
jgi:homoserine O-succinyltransferase